MNDSELENQLRALLPAAPSPELEDRIARHLASPAAGAAAAVAPRSGLLPRPAGREAGPWRWWRDLAWAAAGATAALSVAAFLSPADPPTAPLTTAPATSPELVEDTAFEPAGTTRELLAAEDSEQVLETSEGLVREVRYSFRERHAWTNSRTGAWMEVEVPRQDVYLVPVSLQ